MVVIAGAGMAGLCAAARMRELGGSPTVFEKSSRPGGSMLLSSGVVWRYRSFDVFYKVKQDNGTMKLHGLYFAAVGRF